MDNDIGFRWSVCPVFATEVLMRAIAFHDSMNSWSDYSGKVNLMTAFSDNSNSGGETIEISTKEGYYQNTVPAAKLIRGTRNWECFLQVDGINRIPPENLCTELRQIKGWQYFHFGILMELKASGMVLGEKVERVKFQGKDCLALTFKYDANTLNNDIYKDTNWTIYIDPANYSMQGFKEVGVMNRYAVFSGILNVNGLKLPLCRTYFNNADNSFYMVDLFTNAD